MNVRQNNAAGFTLIEVLIALSILSIALAATMRATAMATTSADEVKLKTYATWVAQNRIAELTARQVFPGSGEQSGEATMAGINFKWQQTTNDTPNIAFRKVDVAVMVAGETHKRAVLTAYLTRGGS